jgi:phage protein D/phage baseplate assembly protein gpV
MQQATSTMVAGIEVAVNGQPLAGSILERLARVTVEQSVSLPSTCTLAFLDAGRGADASDALHYGLLDANPLPIGAEVEIKLGHGRPLTAVFRGEITAQELELDGAQLPLYVVRGYDRGHRLQRGRYSRTFLNMTDSDIARSVAEKAGLTCTSDPTSDVYSYVLQDNQTNWDFLRERAARIGYELYVDGRTVHFARPKVNDPAAAAVMLARDVLRLHLHLTSASQVSDVAVRGWDARKKEAILGKQSSETARGRGGAQQSGTALAQLFETAPMQVSDRPVVSQGEADEVAQGVLDDLAQGSLVLEAEVIGNAALKPGQVVDLKAVGKRFSGTYYVTSARHRYGGRGGYRTEVTVGGRRNGTLLELLGGGRPHGDGARGAVAVGIVTNNKDVENMGRVKVKLPWLGDTIESDWIRILTPHGGNGRGFFWLPEVGDEVLVAFEHGDANRPFVIGSLWNGVDKPPLSADVAVGPDGHVNKRIIKSRSGHTITLDDTTGEERISVIDKSGNNVITIETTTNKITISAQGDLELKAQANVKVTGAQISIQAQSTCQVQGNAETKISGGEVEVEANGPCTIKGKVVNIN